jgi:hypothetical protein
MNKINHRGLFVPFCVMTVYLLGASGVSAQADLETEQLQRQFAEAMEALENDRVNTARRLLSAMVTDHPTLQRARLELARAHYLSADYTAAREEAQRVLDDPNTPPSVRTTVLAFLAQIDQDEALYADRHQWLPSIYTGYMYDSNVNFGVARDVIDVGGIFFNVDNLGQEQSDSALIIDGGVIHTYNPGIRFEAGERTGFFVWQSQANGYYRNYFDEDDFNIGVATLRTGPNWFVPGRWTAGIALQADGIWLGDDYLATYGSLNPAVTWTLKEVYALTVEGIVTYRDYDQNIDSGREGWHEWAGVSLSRYFVDSQLTLEGGVGYNWFNADANFLGYDGADIFVGVTKAAWKNGSVFARGGYRKFDFDDSEPFFNVSRDDDEWRGSVGFWHNITTGFMTDWVIQGNYAYTNNDSDLDLFDYDRNQVELGLSRAF